MSISGDKPNCIELANVVGDGTPESVRFHLKIANIAASTILSSIRQDGIRRTHRDVLASSCCDNIRSNGPSRLNISGFCHICYTDYQAGYHEQHCQNNYSCSTPSNNQF